MGAYLEKAWGHSGNCAVPDPVTWFRKGKDEQNVCQDVCLTPRCQTLFAKSNERSRVCTPTRHLIALPRIHISTGSGTGRGGIRHCELRTLTKKREIQELRSLGKIMQLVKPAVQHKALTGVAIGLCAVGSINGGQLSLWV